MLFCQLKHNLILVSTADRVTLKKAADQMHYNNIKHHTYSEKNVVDHTAALTINHIKLYLY